MNNDTTNNTARQGSLINFYGTDYTVDSIGSAKDDEIMDTVDVTMDNGTQVTLWWPSGQVGCKLIKY